MEHVKVTRSEPEWRVGVTYPHLAVTRDGRVKNLQTDRELAVTVGKTGYAQLCIRPDGRKGRARLVKIHRLVAEAWIGAAPSRRHVVNHRNGVKTDNRVENLEWVTPSENIRHSYRMGMHPRQFGEASNSAKLTDAAVRRIRRVYTPGHQRFGARALGREYGVHHKQIITAARGESWPHLDGSVS